MALELFHGDITTLKVEAIVNAANPRLSGGGGVDGAIHRAAGPKLLAACNEIEEVRPGVRCPEGEVRLTKGFQLPARYVIHTVGPVWLNQGHEPAVLAMCYRNCLVLAAQHEFASIAFPAISTGVYGFPKTLAASIAVREVAAFLRTPGPVRRVVLVAFSSDDYGKYEQELMRS
jgi:O-acetyl-ADP-ribose deacetylase (regulator of RNase III)